MPIPPSALIGSPRRLVSAIVLFVVLDLSVLLINLWLAEQLAQDAVAINLAGRQRMLSQQTTKALLLATNAPTAKDSDAANLELDAAFGLLLQTQKAFAQGGETRGGDGKTVSLKAVHGEAARVVAQAQAIIAPLEQLLSAPAPVGESQAPRLGRATGYMVNRNQDLLSLMNTLTTALEHDSVRRARNLRAIQTGAFVLALGNFLAIVIGMLNHFRRVERDSQQWRELARRDALTGLANRKAFTEAAQGMLARAQGDTVEGALLMLDLDGFKPINDTLGHATGDRVLIALARALESTARTTDVVARLGGDEFAVLCPKLHGQDDITHFCNRLLTAITDLPGQVCPGKRLGASIGVALYPESGYELEHLLGLADKAMYAAKNSGGGRWEIAA